MNARKSNTAQDIKERRDAALDRLVGAIPYTSFLGVSFDRRGDELTATMAYSDQLIGNPTLPAIHGGAMAAFMESVAIIELAWIDLFKQIELDKMSSDEIAQMPFPTLPKVIDITVDYLSVGRPRDTYARARINRSGRRYASVHVETWQDNRSKLVAQATGHFLMPEKPA